MGRLREFCRRIRGHLLASVLLTSLAWAMAAGAARPSASWAAAETQQTSAPSWGEPAARRALGHPSSTRSRAPIVQGGASYRQGRQFDPQRLHSFPRLAILQFGNGPLEYTARFDLLLKKFGGDLTRDRTPYREYIEQVKELNPHARWLVIRDFNAGGRVEQGVDVPEEWYLHNSKGERLELYGRGSYYVNLSDVSPRLAGNIGGIEAGNRIYVDWYAEYISELALSVCADGVGSQGLYAKGHISWYIDRGLWGGDVDLDSNGVNDFVEHGKDWIIDHWVAGTNRLLDGIRQRLETGQGRYGCPNDGEPKWIVINTGSQDLPRPSAINGLYYENSNYFRDWSYSLRLYEDYMERVRQPPIFVLNLDIGSRSADPQISIPTKNYFRWIREAIARAMLLDQYIDINTFEAGEHYWKEWNYDELELDLGYPTGKLQQVRSSGPQGHGIWVRFFDRGVVIANLSGSPQTVRVEEIEGLPGYNGPYWRFRGGQVPELNNGDPFDAAHPIQLEGHEFEKGGVTVQVGDAIILVDRPLTVVSDVVIDNEDHGTSPGSLEAALSPQGSWEETCAGDDFWAPRCVDSNRTRDRRDRYGFALTSSADAVATFTPTIGVSGPYEVFEWHGRADARDLASNVTYTINHAEGAKTMVVDQRAGAGRWNSLGTYNFNAGGEGGVVITARGADGLVMADAVMFVYRGRQQATTFADVPADHWAYQDIEALYQNGFVVGCQAEPMRLFCPQATLSRAEAAVLVVRGVRGADFTPPQPLQSPFEDVALGDWYVDWVSQLWQDGYTAGCWAAPRRYCPLAGHTRAEATVFFTRMLKGPGYVPAGGGDLPYTDVPADAWYRKWVEAAYAQGVIGACEPPAERGDDLFRPEDPLSRAEAACMMARAKGLP